MSQTNEPRARIVLLGDHDPSVAAHRAIPEMLALIGAGDGVALDWQWLPTDAAPADMHAALAAANGVWCVPASPYASTDGALKAIRHARERGIPFLGTCGGFQHAVLEFAANVRGMRASHAELDPDATEPLIAPLSCGLVEEEGVIVTVPGTRFAAICGAASGRETYHCRYGLARHHEAALFGGDLVVGARDDAGEVRAMELTTHPFFVATLFQPERAALRGEMHPVPRAFVMAAMAHARAQGNIRIRTATVADAPVLARHRAGMFRDMGRTDDATHATLVAAAERFFISAVPVGQYIAWLAYSAEQPDVVIAGAGVLVRQIPPFPVTAPDGTFSIAAGRQALVQNVYTEKTWRRRGIAAMLMTEVIAWSEREGIESLVLHASREGRPLYERIGFQQTNEMVYKDPRRFTQ